MNFTWKVEAQESDSVRLKLTFERPELVSAQYEEDVLRVHLHIEDKAFTGKDGLAYLDQESSTLNRKIPK